MYLKKINLKNKIALVTGAGKGIGKACAIALAEAGADLIIISRTKRDLDKVSKTIKKFKSKCNAYVCDVTNYHQVKEIINKQKRIDILVNNAGSNIPEHFTKVQRKDMEHIVRLNTISTFNIAQLCAIKMTKIKNRKKIGASIINMSSQLGHVGAPIRSVYNMTKFGLEGLTKGMAIDLAKNNIRVNTVCPTFVETPMVKKFFKNKKFKKQVINNIPLGRIADASDVATAVAFLASDASSMITGSSILVDGGWTAK
ncbi:MAG: SDR family oxidoreductase [Pelagibacteraceae bacterium]|jgi:NAD(P)-dependent dehydrogenase (short-subunit alcohol dehydrogenase family)|nr:oxidoreductase [Candidatus Pelagibacter sp.]MDP6680162.1 SDR family oxidoreductase [Pelagibacteraceae bacterium]MDP6710747.1 SDR family oxidoreductase [Pelagibacteraceae bacterium]|tara:strand:+ start:3693 stop:4460 length:768 start_codon:yes stop_codon:yes gene_type:complete